MARKPKKIIYFDPKFLEALKANTYLSPETLAHIRFVSGGLFE